MDRDFTMRENERTYIEMLDDLHYAVKHDVIPKKEQKEILNLIYQLEEKLEKYSG